MAAALGAFKRFEVNIHGKLHADPVFSIACEARWNKLAIEQRKQVIAAILPIETHHKALIDAFKARELALKFRGAPDDDGTGWRPTFELYMQRCEEALQRMQDWQKVCENVAKVYRAVFVGPGEEGDEAVRSYLEKIRRQIRNWKRVVAYSATQEGEVERRLESLVVRQDEVDMDIFFPATAAVHAAGYTCGGEDGGRDAVLNLGSRWYTSWPPLGRGAFGEATLWLQEGEDGYIEDRLVLKTIGHRDYWHPSESSQFWVDGIGSTPVEVRAHQLLADKIGSSGIVRLRNWNLVLGSEIILYLEYCPHGDLADLLRNEYYAKNQVRTKNKALNLSASCKFLPEPFLWHVFLSLTLAGLLMEGEQLMGPTLPPDEQHLIIHRDLKLSNILLGPASIDRFRGFPEPKVADFGLSIVMEPGEGYDTSRFGQGGTPSHQAPEQLGLLLQADEDGEYVPQPMSTMTNVWGVGITMWSLIAGKEGPSDSEFNLAIHPEIQEPPEFDKSAQAFYSQELRDLIRACVRWEPEDRPPFDAILAEIQKNVTKNDQISAMRTLHDDDDGFGEAYERHGLPLERPVDTYALGMVFPSDLRPEDEYEE